MNSFGLTTVVLLTLAAVNERSKATLAALKKYSPAGNVPTHPQQITDSLWLLKTVVSMPELRVQMGGNTYFIDKPIVLTSLHIILENSVNLLVLY